MRTDSRLTSTSASQKSAAYPRFKNTKACQKRDANTRLKCTNTYQHDTNARRLADTRSDSLFHGLKCHTQMAKQNTSNNHWKKVVGTEKLRMQKKLSENAKKSISFPPVFYFPYKHTLSKEVREVPKGTRVLEKEKAKKRNQRQKKQQSFQHGRLGGNMPRLNVSENTVHRHTRLLKKFGDKEEEEILQYFEDRLREVKASTVANEMASFAGAESKKEAYKKYDKTIEKINNKNVSRTKSYKMMMKKIQAMAREDDVHYPYPLKKKHLLKTLEHLLDHHEEEAMMFLLIQWVTAARPFCVYQLNPHNIVLKKERLSVLFKKGKGVTMRQSPYTVHTTAGGFTMMVKDYLLSLESDKMFMTPYKEICTIVRTAMRQHSPLYEMRSPRRGALCHMAKRGVCLETLKNFSGHTSDRTLLRYLHWGMHHGIAQRLGKKAGVCLL